MFSSVNWKPLRLEGGVGYGIDRPSPDYLFVNISVTVSGSSTEDSMKVMISLMCCPD